MVTLDQYLEAEREAEFRSEFVAGEIFAMSGGTGLHSKLCVRMISLLSRGPCDTYEGHLKIFIPTANQVLYPDASVVCGETLCLDGHDDVILNPTLVLEVLFPSTENYDKSDKSLYFRSLPSLQHCLVVSQDRLFIEHSTRQSESVWILRSYTKRDDRISLPELNLELTVAEIYQGILE